MNNSEVSNCEELAEVERAGEDVEGDKLSLAANCEKLTDAVVGLWFSDVEFVHQPREAIDY